MSRAEANASPPVEEAAPLFAALGDATRLRLVARLAAAGPASVTRLSKSAEVSRQAVTKHLHVLSQVGLVRSRRTGRERICELRPQRLAEVHAYLDGISRQWDEALGRLTRFVEE